MRDFLYFSDLFLFFQVRKSAWRKIWKIEKKSDENLKNWKNSKKKFEFWGRSLFFRPGKNRKTRKSSIFQFFPRNLRKQPWQAPNPNANEFQIFSKQMFRIWEENAISARKRKKTRKRNNFSLLNIVGNMALEIISGVIFAVKKKKLPNPKITQP